MDDGQTDPPDALAGPRVVLAVVRDTSDERVWSVVEHVDHPVAMAVLLRELLRSPTVSDYEIDLDEDGDIRASYGTRRLVASVFMPDRVPPDLAEMARAALQQIKGGPAN